MTKKLYLPEGRYLPDKGDAVFRITLETVMSSTDSHLRNMLCLPSWLLIFVYVTFSTTLLEEVRNACSFFNVEPRS